MAEEGLVYVGDHGAVAVSEIAQRGVERGEHGAVGPWRQRVVGSWLVPSLWSFTVVADPLGGGVQT
jgi:hypothetical protein